MPNLFAFPGLHYFEDDPRDRQLFFGREQEIKQLTERVIAEDLTVLFGKSGDGKTSLINAGLKAALRELGYLPVRARVCNVAPPATPLSALYDAITEEARAHDVTLPESWQRETLWETFMALRPTPANGLKPVVLVLDQFEELFTLLAARREQQENFIAQLADLVRGRVPEVVREKYRARLAVLPAESEEAHELERLLYGSVQPGVHVLISLREDYVAFLDHLAPAIPKVLSSRYRLPSLSIAQARAAIANPPEQTVLGVAAFHITPEAVEAMLDFLTVQSSRSGVSEAVVGPPQLQVLCRQLEEQMRRQNRNTIEVADLGGEKGMRHLLSRYYRGLVKKFPALRFGPGPARRKSLLGLLQRLQPVHSPRWAVRELCEERLITAGGNRNSRHEEEIVREIGVAENDLSRLVESRLLRREARLEEAFYELSHDSLVPSLQAAGGLRRNWMTSLKIAALASLVFVVMRWGVPFVQSFFVMDTLQTEFKEVQAGNMRAEYFRERLINMRSIVPDTLQLAELQHDFKTWWKAALRDSVLALPVSARARIETFVQRLKREFPLETYLHEELADSLQERRIRAVQMRYSALAQTASDSFALAQAAALLDTAGKEFPTEVRIDRLEEDLAGKRGEFAKQSEIARQIELKEELGRIDLTNAIRLKSPQPLIVQGDSSGGASQFELVLEYSSLLQSSQIFWKAGGQEDEIKPRTRVKDRDYAGLVRVPARVAEFEVEIRAVDKDGNEGRKTFTFKIDRARPRVQSFNAFYRDNEKEEWQNMPVEEWRGKFWRIHIQVSEPLQFGFLDIATGQAKTLPFEMKGTRYALARNELTLISGTDSSFSNVPEIGLSLHLQDLAGWESRLNLGKWKVAKAPAQVFEQTAKPKTPSEKFLSADEVKAMILKNDFYCSAGLPWSNSKGGGAINDFVLESKSDIVFDRTTNLRWQRSGHTKHKTFAQAQEYVAEMNRQKFGGYEDWRLPTLEEAMSLMEPKEVKGLFIDGIFDRRQSWIWTSDKASGSSCWVAHFYNGSCDDQPVHTINYVRLVR